MPRALNLEGESPCGVKQCHSAFSDEAYWLARLANTDAGTARLDSLTIGGDDLRNGSRSAAQAGGPTAPRRTDSSRSRPGSRLNLTGSVVMKVPVIGGAIESFIATSLRNGIKDMQRFTTEWIAQHG